jgi:predicted DCC family thiol-disulfide oxidoreductase YuxK
VTRVTEPTARTGTNPSEARHGRTPASSAGRTQISAGRAPTRPLVIYDGDCGFCTATATWIARRLRRPDGADAQLLPSQRVDLTELGTTDERAAREVLWAQAISQWLQLREGFYGVLGRCLQLPVVSALAAALYRGVAANRRRLPGGTPTCALPPLAPAPSAHRTPLPDPDETEMSIP